MLLKFPYPGTVHPLSRNHWPGELFELHFSIQIIVEAYPIIDVHCEWPGYSLPQLDSFPLELSVLSAPTTKRGVTLALCKKLQLPIGTQDPEFSFVLHWQEENVCSGTRMGVHYNTILDNSEPEMWRTITSNRYNKVTCRIIENEKLSE